ncbi:hypothetical protein E2C01_029344 [Portunus trituberculatus]|uniref:Uncharacterized protein n=1 Tax=Portunus trituberculatus TaxID=210409 RepID=A0A5B7ERM6_PORTR|nr:hypothetical protein [Portunus trituberculatus]
MRCGKTVPASSPAPCRDDEIVLFAPYDAAAIVVSVKNGSGHVVWESQGRQPPLWPGEDHPGVLPSFNAYSAPGLVQVR